MTRKEQNKILDDKIETNVNQYKVDRLNAEISAFSSGDLNKPNALDKARFEFSPLDRVFNEGLDKTIPNYQEESVMKLLKEIRDNLAGGVNRPAGFIMPPDPPGPQGRPGPQGPQSPPGPLPPAPGPLGPQPPASGTTINTQMSLLPIITTINTQMPLSPIITTINTRLLSTPSLPSLPSLSSLRTPSLSSLPTLTPTPISVSTPSRIPVPISTPSRIPIPILNPSDEGKVFTPFNIKKPSPDPLDNIKSSSKVSHDDNGDIDDDILYDYVPYDRRAPGTATAEIAIENDIKNSYDSINYLQNKLLDANVYDERNKILNDIDLAKKIYLKRKRIKLLGWD